ncbi:MAG: N-acetylmuramoyl-L-alanine amidase A [candidate division WS2 bacterium]|nr:N-acetylmuramoyl-L-alanine amidase A [Candidatus Lithacetigena glycinireducens]
MNIEHIPGITKFGYPQGREGRSGLRPTALVIHVMEGTIRGTTSWFMNPRANVSYNYGVGKDGRIVCWVRDENAAWANGKIQKPTWKGLLKRPNGYINPNLHTISIAREGRNSELCTPRQYQSLLHIARLMIDKYRLPINRNTVIGHYEIDSRKPLCPGRINLDHFVIELRKNGQKKEEGGELLGLSDVL